MVWLWVQMEACGREGMAVNGSGWARRRIDHYLRSCLTANWLSEEQLSQTSRIDSRLVGNVTEVYLPLTGGNKISNTLKIEDSLNFHSIFVLDLLAFRAWHFL